MDTTTKKGANPFKTSVEAAVAYLIGKGKIKRDTDVVRDLKMSKGTFSAYKNGTTKPSKNFVQQFENKYGVNLSAFEVGKTMQETEIGYTLATSTQADPYEHLKAENEMLRHMIRLNDKMDRGLELMQQHSTDLSKMNQTLHVIEQQQEVSSVIDAQFEQFVIGRLVDKGDPVDILEGLQRRAFEVLENIRQANNRVAQHNQHSTAT